MDPETFKDQLAEHGVLSPLQGDLRDEIPVSSEQVDAAWRTLVHSIAAESSSSVNSPSPSSSKLMSRLRRGEARLSRWGWAAAAVGVVLAVLWWGTSSRIPARPGVTRTYATDVGHSALITLDDGTRVVLAPRSTIQLVHFNATRRTVQLDGEAYFDVARTDGAPFVVRTGDVATRVLGTAFLMRHYAGEHIVRVSVAEGKVGVTMPRRDESSVLVAGDVGEIGDSTITFHSVDHLDTDAEWIGGRLFFNDVSVKDVLAALTRWYGYQFHYTDATIAPQRVTVWLSTRSSADALATLERLLNISATVAGDTVTLVPRRGALGPRMRHNERDELLTPTKEVGR